jgi:penicillin-binding protein 1A
VGLPKIADAAHRMGIPAKVNLRQVITLPIGTSEVTPLEMASAYSTLAADGVHHAPTFIEKVVDSSNNVQFQGASTGDRVVSAQNARTVTQALQGVVDHGTGTNARITDGRPVAGKTGTTDHETDAWFVGYTPQLVTAVWMGSPSGHVPMQNVPGAGQVFGGTYPAKIFSAFMSSTLSGQPVQNFNAPDPSPPGTYLTVPDSPNALPAPLPPPPPPAPEPAPPPDMPVPGAPPTTDTSILVPPPPKHGTTTSSSPPTTGP